MKLRYQIAATMVLVMLACSVLSCQLFPTGATDEELVAGILGQFARGVNQKNMDLIEPTLSEDFEGLQGESKSTVVESMPQMLESASPTIDVSEAEITVEGDKATASPIKVDAMGGVTVLTFDFAKRDGKWFITKHAQGS